MTERAVILLSGGLDSSTVLACAKREGFDCHALSFSYGQRHEAELMAAKRVAGDLGVAQHRILSIPVGEFGGSAITDERVPIPTGGTSGIPVTYVPARNTVFLAFGLAWAEVIDARALYIGVNAVDYSGYPDCRPEFIEAFQGVANLATKQAVEGAPVELRSPLVDLSKAEIIRLGAELGVDYALTVSCYQPDDDGAACGVCDACRLRREGFTAAGMPDPTRYQSSSPRL